MKKLLVKNERIITGGFLKKNPNHIFVFGDNVRGKGYGGAAKLRDFKNAWGFVTKKNPTNADASFFRPDNYAPVFERELARLKKDIERYPEKTFMITRLGAELANKFGIYQEVIKPRLKQELSHYENVEFLYEEYDE